MQARLVQTTDMPPGHAELHLARLGQIGDGIEICLGLPAAGSQAHLDPRDETKPWGSAEFWFAPPVLRRDGDGAVLGLDPATTFHLRANQPYILALRDAAGQAAKAPLLGIALRVPSTPPKGWGASKPAAPIAEPPPPPPEPVAAPPAPAPKLVVEVRQPAPPPPIAKKDGAPIGLILGLIVLLALAGGGAWWWFNRPAPQVAEAPPAPAASPPAAAPARTLDAARKALAAGPPAADALALGKEHLAAKDLDGAFLLFRAAGEKGNAEADVIVGGFYDPATWTKETSPLPAANADQAANWYRRAAETGDAEAQYRLGMVLKSGKTEGTDGPEQAVAWLRKAAEQGHQKAKEALGP
jgi:hypothetical protein